MELLFPNRTSPPTLRFPEMWSASPALSRDVRIMQAQLNIDGAAGTTMSHYAYGFDFGLFDNLSAYPLCLSAFRGHDRIKH